MPFDKYDFCLEDYKLWLEYRAAHSDRMWTRFNYFLVAEGVLAGFFTITGTNDFVHRGHWAAVVETAISLVWALVGARDALIFRAIDLGAKRSADRLRASASPDLDDYDRVTVRLTFSSADWWHVDKVLGRLFGNEPSNMTVTAMAVRLPVFATVAWGLLAGILTSESAGGYWYWGAVGGASAASASLFLLGVLAGVPRDTEAKTGAREQTVIASDDLSDPVLPQEKHGANDQEKTIEVE